MRISNYLYFSAIFLLIASCEQITGLGAKPEARFIKLFGGDFMQEGIALVELPESKGFALLGTTNAYTGGVHKDLYFVMTDEAGNWTRQEHYNLCRGKDTLLLKDDYAAELLLTDKGFLLVGSTSIGDDTQEGNLIFLDWKGETLERQCLDTRSNELFYGALRDKAGNYILLGSTDQNKFSKSDKDSSDFLILKYSNGTLKLDNSFGFEGVDEMVSAVEVGDHIYCLGTETKVATKNLNKDYYIAKFNSEGLKIAEKHINPTQQQEKNDLATQLLYNASEQALYIIGTTSIVKLNEDFNDLDLYILPDNKFARSAHIFPDGSLLLIGEIQDNNESDIWLAKLDNSLDVLWEKRFGGTEKDKGSDLLVLADGSIVMIGTIGFGETAMMALIKTDPEGNL